MTSNNPSKSQTKFGAFLIVQESEGSIYFLTEIATDVGKRWALQSSWEGWNTIQQLSVGDRILVTELPPTYLY